MVLDLGMKEFLVDRDGKSADMSEFVFFGLL